MSLQFNVLQDMGVYFLLVKEVKNFIIKDMKTKKINKILLTLSSLTLVSGLTSCGTSSKINLVYGRMVDNKLVEIDYSELNSMIEDEKTFLLAVTPTSNCACWATFEHILEEYIAENHVTVYKINNQKFYNSNLTQLDTFGISIYSDRETFTIFENGKLKEHRVYNQKDYIFKQTTNFNSYMDSVIVLPTIFEISLEQLNKIYESGKAATVYFARSNCPDCNYIDSHFLKEYGTNNTEMNPLYYIDCEKIDGLRVYDDNNQLTSQSQIDWQEFKDNYGLSDKYNTVFGYDNGYVPTFSLIKGNGTSFATSIVSSSVYFNDEISLDGGKYVVSNSYYTSERISSLTYTSQVLKGLELGSDDVNVYTFEGNNYYSWKHESAENYHSPILKDFLDYALVESEFVYSDFSLA